MAGKEEVSGSGSPVWRHTAEAGHRDDVRLDKKGREKLDRHIQKHIGPIENVWHEIRSPYAHIDLIPMLATDDRPWHMLLSQGMSDQPMHVPEDIGAGYDYAELLINLPADWPMDMDSWKDERNYWPIRALKEMARLPRMHDTWLWCGHTLGNEDPPRPYADDTELCAMLLISPMGVPEGFESVKIRRGKVVHFFSLFPLYAEELQFKMDVGLDGLIERFGQREIDPLVVDKNRPNVCA